MNLSRGFPVTRNGADHGPHLFIAGQEQKGGRPSITLHAYYIEIWLWMLEFLGSMRPDRARTLRRCVQAEFTEHIPDGNLVAMMSPTSGKFFPVLFIRSFCEV